MFLYVRGRLGGTSGIFLAADIFSVLGRPVRAETRDLWSGSQVTESEKAREETLFSLQRGSAAATLARIPPPRQSTAVRGSDVSPETVVLTVGGGSSGPA